MGTFKYVTAVTVCAVLYAGFFILGETSVDFQNGLGGLQKLLIAMGVGLLPAASLAGVYTKEFELERFVGRVVIIAGLGAMTGWLAARGILALAMHLR
jgi:hypothetical protein